MFRAVTDADLQGHPPGLTAHSSTLALYGSDYRAHCRRKSPESARRRRLLALPRLLVNPSLQALFVLRVANASPRATWWIWRNFFVRMHAMDWSGPLEIGPGFELPHPIGVLLLRGSRIGADVAFGHNITLSGAQDGGTPTIGDRVVVFTGVVIVGGVTVGEDVVISANCLVSRDIPARKLVTQHGLLPVAAMRGRA